MTDKHKHIIGANMAISSSVSGAKRPPTPLNRGAGQAVQSISQSIAIAVQDAVDTMRNIATVQSSALGVATQKHIETKDHEYIPIRDHCQKSMNRSVEYWESVGKKGADILTSYRGIFVREELNTGDGEGER